MEFIIGLLFLTGLVVWERSTRPRNTSGETVDERPAPTGPQRSVPATNARQVYAKGLGTGHSVRLVQSPWGPFNIVAKRSGHIKVYFPDGVGYRHDIAHALWRETGRDFIMDRRSLDPHGFYDADATILAWENMDPPRRSGRPHARRRPDARSARAARLPGPAGGQLTLPRHVPA